jgi:hypothetical protein
LLLCSKNYVPQPAADNKVHASVIAPGPVFKPLTRLAPTSSNCKVTDEKLEGFREDPSTLLGKQFILDENDGEDERDSDDQVYEVVEVRLLRGGEKIFHVQFAEGYSDYMGVASEEMMEMLRRSTFVEV